MALVRKVWLWQEGREGEGWLCGLGLKVGGGGKVVGESNFGD